MNENVGSIIKKMAKFEWIVGIVIVILKTIVHIAIVFLAKYLVTGYITWTSSMYYITGNAGVPVNYNSVVTWVIVIDIVLWLISVAFTLYSCYKKQLT